MAFQFRDFIITEIQIAEESRGREGGKHKAGEGGYECGRSKDWLGWAWPVEEREGQRAFGTLDVSLELDFILWLTGNQPLKNFKLGSSCDKREFSRRMC